jgi:hypothetical protein
MSYLKSMSLSLLSVAVLMAGCSQSDNKSAATATKDAKKAGPAAEHSHGGEHSHDGEHAHDAEHAHGAGPNGGVVFDLGSHHAEFTVDHGKKECQIVVLGDDEKTPAAIAAGELLLHIKETKTKEGTVVPPMTIMLKPAETTDGKASKFVGTDPGLGNVADFAGTVSGELDGKPFQGDFKE